MHIQSQPNDTTCGPTCLHAVYEFYNHHLTLEELIKEVSILENGGTLAVFLGIDALKRGFQAKIISYNLQVFDPSWKNLKSKQLILKLEQQLESKTNRKLRTAIKAYIKYLSLGGELSFELLTSELINNYLRKEIPILTGVSSTYLYGTRREYTVNDKNIYDDVRGEPSGHFIVLYGTNKSNLIKVADPFTDEVQKKKYYTVENQRLMNSILLGALTYDANLLIIQDKVS